MKTKKTALKGTTVEKKEPKKKKSKLAKARGAFKGKIIEVGDDIWNLN